METVFTMVGNTNVSILELPSSGKVRKSERLTRLFRGEIHGHVNSNRFDHTGNGFRSLK